MLNTLGNRLDILCNEHKLQQETRGSQGRWQITPSSAAVMNVNVRSGVYPFFWS